MKISKEGLDLIKKFEGLRLKAYKCPAGVWTIGYGSTVGVVGGQEITEEEAEKLLLDDVFSAWRAVMELVTVPLSQEQFDALVSFVFNVGIGNFSKSTLLKKLNAGDYLGAAKEFLKWDKATVNGVKKPLAGLTKRRIMEKELFLRGTK
jgi:lysozyme